MPKLPAVVETLDVVPEAHRELYVEQDGKFVLDVDGVDGHPLAASGKKALREERKARETAESELRAWKAIGMTPEQIAELKKKISEAEQKGGDPDATERLIRKRVAEAMEEVKPQLERLSQVEAENRKLKVTDGIRAAFLGAEGIEDDADDVVRLTEHRFRLNDRGALVVIDEDGDESSLSPKAWFAKEYKKLKPKYFKGTEASGSGAREATNKAGDGVVVLTPEQAADAPTYRAALEQVKGDHSKIQVK